MKHATAAILIVCIAGCGAVPLESLSPYEKAVTSYITIMSALVELRSEGYVSDEAYRQIEPIRAAAWWALRTWDETASPADFEAAKVQLQSYLEKAALDKAKDGF